MDDFFPATASPPMASETLPASRMLLVGPPDSGKTSLLLQLAFNRARRGLTSLLISCGPPDGLAMHPPARPRCSSSTTGAENSSVTSGAIDPEESRLLRLVHIKYVATWPELQEVLASLHLPEAQPDHAEGLPRGLFIDGLSSLFLRGLDALHGDVSSQVATPSPSKPEQQRATMLLALALALCSHAADYLEAAASRATVPASAASSSGALVPSEMLPMPTATTPGPPGGSIESFLLVVACSTKHAPEDTLAGRWLPVVLKAMPISVSRGGGHSSVYTLSLRHSGSSCNEASCHYKHVPGRSLELLDDAQGQRAGASSMAMAVTPQALPVVSGAGGGYSASPHPMDPLASAIF